MACTGRYAEAWEYAAFWCVGNILFGADDSGGAANAFLTDSQIDFLTFGVEANVGMVLYNTTQNTSGQVTVVTLHTITATGVTWDDGDAYRIVLITKAERSTIEHYLNIAAGDIHVALAASGACDCTLSDWGANYLSKLNIIDAAAYYNCKCGDPRMSDERKAALLTWVSSQLDLIRVGKQDVCAGATGADFPAFGWAAQSVTEFAIRDIIFNSEARNT